MTQTELTEDLGDNMCLKELEGPYPEGFKALHPKGVEGLPRNVSKTHTPQRTLQPREFTSQKTLRGCEVWTEPCDTRPWTRGAITTKIQNKKMVMTL
jgi:hypothetical protein